MSDITPAFVAQHRLSAEEDHRVLHALGSRQARELGIFTVMWSEQCSYKSSQIHLGTLAITGPQVICGPGEDAGVIDIGDSQAAIFKMESHNDPPYIEPRQGAATGVGEILLDGFMRECPASFPYNQRVPVAVSGRERTRLPAIHALLHSLYELS